MLQTPESIAPRRPGESAERHGARLLRPQSDPSRMDFRTCPACQASVLEDDVADCPFCGASMTGKPAAKPKPAAAPAKAGATAATRPETGTRPAATKTAAARPKSAAVESPAPADDGDPFDVDTRAVRQAVPISPKPLKGRTVRIVCPMCETAGFIGPQHAGKDVKCCNPECLVPVFTAPRPEAAKKDAEPEPAKGMSTGLLTTISVVLLGAVAAGVYFGFLRNGQQPQRTGTQGETPMIPTPVATQANDTPTETAPPKPKGPPPVPLEEVRQVSLVEIVKRAQQRENRSKPYSRRLAAEAFAEVGRLDDARQQLEAMPKVAGYQPFYEVEALVAMALAERAAGNAGGAKAALDAALAKADFPSVGRGPLDAAAALAAALVASGRANEARQVLQSAQDTGSRGEMSTLWRHALDSRSFDVDAAARRPYFQSMPAHQWVTVTAAVVSLGEPQAALAWAQSARSVPVVDNCLAAWAGGLMLSATQAERSQALAQIELAASGFAPAAQARVWAAVADAQLSLGDRESAQTSLEKAANALAAITPPRNTLAMPDMAAIHDGDGKPHAGLPDPAPWHTAALAAADVAQVRGALGAPDGAWESLQRALALARAMTPSPSAARAVRNECEENEAGVKARLTQTLGVEGNRQFLAFNRYRKQCTEIRDAADARFALQVALLRRAVEMGLLSHVWDEVRSRDGQTDLSEREPYLETSLPGMVALHARSTGLTDLAAAVEGAVGSQQLRFDAVDRMERALDAALRAKKYADAAAVLSAYERTAGIDPYPAQRQAVRAVGRLVAGREYAGALEFITALTNPLTREDAWWLIAAASVRDGEHSVVWRKSLSSRMSATDWCSLYRGMIAGLPLAPRPAAPDEAGSQAGKPPDMP